MGGMFIFRNRVDRSKIALQADLEAPGCRDGRKAASAF